MKIVKPFAVDKRIVFVLDKRRTLNTRHGKADTEGSEAQEGERIEPTDATDTHKYHGMPQSRQIECTETQETTDTLTDRHTAGNTENQFKRQTLHEGQQHVRYSSINVVLWHSITV
jgi:hypothetical protein